MVVNAVSLGIVADLHAQFLHLAGKFRLRRGLSLMIWPIKRAIVPQFCLQFNHVPVIVKARLVILLRGHHLQIVDHSLEVLLLEICGLLLVDHDGARVLEVCWRLHLVRLVATVEFASWGENLLGVQIFGLQIWAARIGG